MIQVVHEHSVDLSVLPEKANILDLGCRGFGFTDYFLHLNHNVFPVDIDDLQGSYIQAAICGHEEYAEIVRSGDPQGTSIGRKYYHGANPIDSPSVYVKCYTLASFSKNVNIKFWDLIKMDIEGSEYEVVMSLTEPPAIQLSIEFHLHTGIYGDTQIKEMEDKLLSLGYFPTKHDKTNQHGAGFNYWDSLFVLQSHRKEYSEPTNY